MNISNFSSYQYNDIKIRRTGMSHYMIESIKQIIIKIMNIPVENDKEYEHANNISKELEKKFGGYWSCVIYDCKTLSGFVLPTIESDFLYMACGNRALIIFKNSFIPDNYQQNLNTELMKANNVINEKNKILEYLNKELNTKNNLIKTQKENINILTNKINILNNELNKNKIIYKESPKFDRNDVC